MPRPSPWGARSSGSSDVTDRRRLVRVPASSANLGPGYDVLAAALSRPPRAGGHRGGRVLGRHGWPAGAGRSLEPVRARLRDASPGGRPAIRGSQRDPARPRPRLLGGGDRRRAGGRRPPVRAGPRARADLRPRGRARGPPRQRRRGALRGRRGLPAGRRRRAAASAGEARASPGRRGRGRDPGRGGPDREGARRDARRRAGRRRGRQHRRRLAARPRHRALRPDADLARAGGPPPPAEPRRHLSPLDGAARARRRPWGRSGRRSPAPGPPLLFWCFWQDTGKVTDALRERIGNWAEIRRTPFTPLGADVPEL